MDWPRLAAPFRARSPGLLLLLILVIALGLRLYGIGWDQGYGFHPDERSIYMRSDCMYRVLTQAQGYESQDCFINNPGMKAGFPSLPTVLDADESPLNPHWFPLGNLLVYLIVGIRLILEPFLDLGSLLSMAYIGRSIMAVADVGTVLMVYLLGRRIYETRAGLLASALVALAVVHIQSSHFYRPEPLLIFFLMVSFWSMLQVLERRRTRDWVLLGAAVGLTFATKVSVVPLFLPLLLVLAFRLHTISDGNWTNTSPLRETNRVAAQALLAGAVAVAAFFVTTPYALLDIGDFVSDITFQANEVAKTAGKVPFTVQYIGTTPFLYELRQTSVWGLGLPLGIVAWSGLLFSLFMAGRALLGTGFTPGSPVKAPRGELLLLAWVVPNIILLSIFETRFLRYIFPTLPFLILMGSAMLLWLLDRARTLSRSSSSEAWVRGTLVRYAPHVVLGIIATVVAATAFYALAFETIYSRPHPAIQASEWINENISRPATIITDNHWDEGIPGIYSYRVHQIPIYNPDSPSKMDTIAGYLSQGDNLVFYSNRTYGSVARLPERYPLSSRYYQLLFSGRLGYELEETFTSYPELLGVAFVDDTFTRAGLPEPTSGKTAQSALVTLDLGYADENAIDYDHPKVLLFRNVEHMSRSQLYQLLTAPGVLEEPAIGLMMSPELKAAQRAGGTWSDIVKRDSWTNRVPVLAWLLLVELISLAALPLAMFLFRYLPDRGIVLGKLLGILAVCYVAWLLTSLGWMGFSRTSVLVGILVVGSLSALVLVKGWREILEYLRGHWRQVAIGEVLFLVAFLAFVAIRAANPDLWHPFRGGEKPMDFAYFNAVLRSTEMPPYDPWFAGGYLNYYYWGQFIVAALTKATGIIPSVAYNLAVPLLFALTVTAAYSLVYNLAAGIRGTTSRLSATSLPMGEESGKRSRSVAWGPVSGGMLAALFVAVIGNLDGVAQVIKGGWDRVVHGTAYPSLEYLSDFWRSSRMLPKLEDVEPSALTFWLPDRIRPEIGHHITEFPFFSFLFADLHAHMIVIPFTLLAVGLGLSLLVGIRSGAKWWLAAVGTALAVSLGVLWTINSWDYPTYVLLTIALIGAGAYLRPGGFRERLGLFLVLAPATVLLSILAFLPFHMDYHPYPTGLDVSRWQTPLHNFLSIYGLFLFQIVSFLVYFFWSQLKVWLSAVTRTLVALHAPARFWDAPAASAATFRAVPWTLAAVAVVAVVVLYMAATGYWTAAVLSLVLAATVWAAKATLSREREDAPYALFPLVLVILALLIAIGVEFVRVQDDIGRMNTLFKYYLEVWILLALASGYVIWFVGSKGMFRLARPSLARGAWLAVLLILLASSIIYPAISTGDRLSDRFNTQGFTLDGADFMMAAVYRHPDGGPPIELLWDYQAIGWLQDNVVGSPVVLEAHDAQYRWNSRISDYTGLPTVIGWPWHQIQQRMKYYPEVHKRAAHVKEMYSTMDIERTLELLKRYDVEYVVVGQLEQAYYPTLTFGKFDRMVQQELATVVYENEGTMIYRGSW